MKFNKISVHLDQLYLDPNNYRFIDEDDYQKIPIDDVMKSDVQKKTLRFLVGTGQIGISDLLSSIKSNGFLEFEQIQVRYIAEGKYLVVEGNRRVATLKILQKEFNDNDEFVKLIKNPEGKIPVSVIEAYSERDNYIAMGIQHIGGKKKWSPLNQARLLKSLLTEYQMSEEDICNSLGLKKTVMRSRIRALALADAYIQSDFGDQFRSDKFSFFEEILKRPELKAWLMWDDKSGTCGNIVNQERIFNWLSFVDDEDDENPRHEPIITKAIEIRDLGGFIHDENVIRIMENTRDFSEARLNATHTVSEIQQKISKINKAINSICNEEDSLTDNDFQLIKDVYQNIKGLLATKDSNISMGASLFLSEKNRPAFSSIFIKKFRGLSDLKIEKLSRINLFVGDNNSGKTSLLEAIFMLTQMNNLSQYLKIEKFRAKADKGLSPIWLADYLDESYDIEGQYDGATYNVYYEQKKDESLNLNKTGYVTTMRTRAKTSLTTDNYEMRLHLYDRKESVPNYNKLVAICPSAFSSAYRKDMMSLLDAYTTVIEQKKKGILVEFIRENFNEGITDINLVGDDENYRFMVTSSKFENAIDVTKYGEGLQRVLEISMYVLSCTNGCAFIDEIDSGIHKSLLDKFIRRINELCETYNVQLFTSTHNRECVDSFVQLEDNVTAFRLEYEGDSISATYSDAKSLLPLMKQFNIDIR